MKNELVGCFAVATDCRIVEEYLDIENPDNKEKRQVVQWRRFKTLAQTERLERAAKRKKLERETRRHKKSVERSRVIECYASQAAMGDDVEIVHDVIDTKLVDKAYELFAEKFGIAVD